MVFQELCMALLSRKAESNHSSQLRFWLLLGTHNECRFEVLSPLHSVLLTAPRLGMSANLSLTKLDRHRTVLCNQLYQSRRHC